MLTFMSKLDESTKKDVVGSWGKLAEKIPSDNDMI